MNPANNGATIPYQLRHHKAIERNLFVDLLKKLNAHPQVKLADYKYVGFGAAFLEDFKLMHLEFGISKMDSIEGDEHAYTRQVFNKPYDFIKSINCLSSSYLNEFYDSEFPMIIWFDYASPNELRSQLLEIEELGRKVLPFDILKFTFNAQTGSLIKQFNIKEGNGVQTPQELVRCLKGDGTFADYVPPTLEVANMKNFDSVVRSMAVRAINRGLASTGGKLKFNLLSAFKYADGQTMTTLSGIVTEEEFDFPEFLEVTGLIDWPFLRNSKDDFVESDKISVPSMTLAERNAVDRTLYSMPTNEIHSRIEFKYGSSAQDHEELIGGYCRFYKYLPYYGKVIY